VIPEIRPTLREQQQPLLTDHHPKRSIVAMTLNAFDVGQGPHFEGTALLPENTTHPSLDDGDADALPGVAPVHESPHPRPRQILYGTW
jgi:hypothetical protein